MGNWCGTRHGATAPTSSGPAARGLGASLHAQADAGGDGGVVGDFVGDGGAGDTGRGAGAFAKQRAAAGQHGQRRKGNQGKRAAARVGWRDGEQTACPPACCLAPQV
ncbi:hypothetical protein G6F22_020923 [Rhizopus arrhizus]|nr:hypothetical protein G6F22_020923 [Rhizopus arrhizus]